MQPEPSIHDYLSKEEIRGLLSPSDARGWLSVATTWGLIAGALALAIWRPHPLTIGFALIILGGRHLALAILMHEAAHRSLFRTRRLNDLVGTWLCAAPTWQDVKRYREHHLTHHAHTNSDADPDRALMAPFPTSRRSLARKFARDLLAITGIKRLIGLFLMDFGFLTYTVAGDPRPIPRAERNWRSQFLQGARNVFPVVVTNATLFAILYALGAPWAYGLWALSYLTTFSLFIRIRSIAEHACTDLTDNAFANTRTIQAGPIARLTVAPHHVNYHLEHHLLMTVPHYRLRRMHRLLFARGVYETSPFAKNYLEVLRVATSH